MDRTAVETLVEPLDAGKGALLIEAVGNPGFGQILLEIAHSISSIDELFGYLVVDGKDPASIVSASFLENADQRVNSYMQRFYYHDFVLHEISNIKAGRSFAKRISLSSIIPYDYRAKCFDEPGFSEKLSFGWRGKDYLLVLSFYRRDNSDQSALAKLASLANLTLATMVRHHVPEKRETIVDLLERRIARSFSQLTVRERQVCARTIAGHSAQLIGEELGIGAGTVLTYRQRACPSSEHLSLKAA